MVDHVARELFEEAMRKIRIVIERQTETELLIRKQSKELEELKKQLKNKSIGY